MKSLFAFMKKEFAEQLRSGRLMILGLLFVLFGIMNPAIAKLTPWLLETMADSLAESGMIITDVKVSAMDSWVQFYKNTDGTDCLCFTGKQYLHERIHYRHTGLIFNKGP